MSPIKKLIAVWIVFCVPATLWTYAQMFAALWEKWGYWCLLVSVIHVTSWYCVALALDSRQQPLQSPPPAR